MLISVPVASRRFGINPVNLYRAVRHGKIRSQLTEPPGRPTLLIELADVESYAATCPRLRPRGLSLWDTFRWFVPIPVPPPPLDVDGDCLLWPGAVSGITPTGGGYGMFRYHGKAFYAHRIAWEIAFGAIPHGRSIDHHCHRQRCVNTDHLFLATSKQQNENRPCAKSNPTGVRGVQWVERVALYRVRVGHNGKQYHVGYFKALADAEEAAIAKRNEFFTNNVLDR
jgi:hypothetical protein